MKYLIFFYKRLRSPTVFNKYTQTYDAKEVNWAIYILCLTWRDLSENDL